MTFLRTATTVRHKNGVASNAAFYLRDTNTVSYVLKGNIPEVRRHLARVPMAEVAVSVVTEAELRFGGRDDPPPDSCHAVEGFLLRVLFARGTYSGQSLRPPSLRSEQAGTPLGNLDMMIAAHARAVNAALAIHDRALQRIKRLKTEDWTKA